MKSEVYLYQLIDSAFPTGAFSHSFGLETAFQEKKIVEAVDLFEWTRDYITAGIVPTEGKAVAITYRIICDGKVGQGQPEQIQNEIQSLDHRITLSKIPKEAREGSIKIGKRYLNVVNILYPESGLKQYEKLIKQDICYGNPAIVHGWISAYLEIPLELAIFTHIHTSVSNLLQSALRLTFVGQTDVQMILKELYPLISEETKQIVELSPEIEDIFTYSIIQEIESMRHEALYSRLFMS